MYKKSKKLLVLCLVVSMLLTNILAVSAFAETRHSGADRYATAAAIAATFEEADTAILATGVDYPDALCAAPLAKALNAPILLTEKNSLSSDAKDALEDLGVEKVIIVGGTAAVSKAVEDELAKDYTVERLAGDDRIATSLAIAEALAEEVDEITEVMLATAANYPDALSASPIAADLGMPILLTNKDSVADDVVEFIGDAKVYVLGGTAVISDKVADLFDDAERLGGADRYATNYEIMNAFAEDLDWSKVYVATGENFPDALAGSVLAAGFPLVLVSSSLNSNMADLLETNVTSGTEVVVFGGTSAVSASVVKRIEAICDGSTVEVDKVEAATDTVDMATADQVLKVKVGGSVETVDSLENSGYTVNFVADKDVFSTTSGKVSHDGNLSVYKLIKIYNDEEKIADRSFSYQVQVLEDGVVIGSSAKHKVTIRDEVSMADDITAVHVYRVHKEDNHQGHHFTRYYNSNHYVTDIEIESGKLVRSEKYYIGEIEATVEGVAIDDLTVAEGYDVKYTTSKPGVATVDGGGYITPISEGKVTITVESGNTSYDLDFEVVSGARVARSVELDTDEIKIVQGVSDQIEVTATVLDQYGDPKDGVDFDDVALFNTEIENTHGQDIANVNDESPWETDTDGEVSFLIDTEDIHATGTGTLEIVDKVTNEVFDTLTVTTKVSGGSAAYWKLVNADGDESGDYDPYNDGDTLFLQAFDGEDFFLGLEHNAVAALDLNGQNLLKFVDDNFNDGDIEFAVKTDNYTGKATVYAKRGNLILATYKVTLVDDPDTTLGLFTFQPFEITGTNAGPFDLRTEVFRNAILTSGGRPYFVAIADNKVGVFDSIDDSHIATIVMDATLYEDGIAFDNWYKFVRFEESERYDDDHDGSIHHEVELVFDYEGWRRDFKSRHNYDDEQFDIGVTGQIYINVYKGANSETSALLTTGVIDVDVK